MKYFDSHTHTNDLKISHEYEQIKQICNDKQVYMNIVGCNIDEFDEAINQALNNSCAYATIGIHPTYTYDKNLESTLIKIKELVTKFSNKIVAIGEIGLDYHYPDTNKEIQAKWFRAQIELALELNLPIQMHIRDAMEDAIRILKEYENRGLVAIFHCFAGNVEDVTKTLAMDVDFYYSFAGNLTYKNAHNLHEAIQVVPLNKLLCETDAPYLSPVPLRGQTNYPYNVVHVYEWISNKFYLDLNKLTDQIFENTLRVFKINKINKF